MNLNEAKHVAEQFGLNGQCNVVKDSAIVWTDSGYKCIKKIGYCVERLMFIHEVKEHLIKNGFYFVDRFLILSNNNLYVAYNDGIYVLTEWINGRECNFSDLVNVKIASQRLAQLHYCSMGFSPSEGVIVRNELGKLPTVLKRRSEELLKLKKIARNRKNKFDHLYMQNADFFIERSINSLKIIDSYIYANLIEKAQRDKGICHKDYSYYNLVFNEQDELYVTNFDYCCYEIKVYDLASFLRKVMNEHKWNVEIAINVIDWYNTVNKIDEDEMQVIFALMEFPQRFWRIVNRFYNSRRTCPETELYNKLVEIVSEKEYYMEFLKRFKEYAGCKN